MKDYWKCPKTSSLPFDLSPLMCQPHRYNYNIEASKMIGDGLLRTHAPSISFRICHRGTAYLKESALPMTCTALHSNCLSHPQKYTVCRWHRLTSFVAFMLWLPQILSTGSYMEVKSWRLQDNYLAYLINRVSSNPRLVDLEKVMYMRTTIKIIITAAKMVAEIPLMPRSSKWYVW